jgi:hypothetical protein
VVLDHPLQYQIQLTHTTLPMAAVAVLSQPQSVDTQREPLAAAVLEMIQEQTVVGKVFRVKGMMVATTV